MNVTRSPVQPTIKALAFDGGGRLLVLLEDAGCWDLPGGRLEPGESFASCLERECLEEAGVSCRVLDTTPHLAWTAADKDGFWRVMLCFRVTLDAGAVRPCGECVRHRFVTRAELAGLDLYPQTRPLLERL